MNNSQHIIPSKLGLYTRRTLAAIAAVLTNQLAIKPILLASPTSIGNTFLLTLICMLVTYAALLRVIVQPYKHKNNKALIQEFMALYCRFESSYNQKPFYSNLFRLASNHTYTHRFKYSDYEMREIVDEMRKSIGLPNVRALQP